MKSILLSLSIGVLLCGGLTSCDTYVDSGYAVARPYGYYPRYVGVGPSFYSSRYYYPTSYYSRSFYPTSYRGGSYYPSNYWRSGSRHHHHHSTRYLAPTRTFHSTSFRAPSSRSISAGALRGATSARVRAAAAASSFNARAKRVSDSERRLLQARARTVRF